MASCRADRAARPPEADLSSSSSSGSGGGGVVTERLDDAAARGAAAAATGSAPLAPLRVSATGGSDVAAPAPPSSPAAAAAAAAVAARAVHSSDAATDARDHDRIVVAGTFDRMHDGHYGMLHQGFAHARNVEVWVTDDAACAAKARKVGQDIQPYADRVASLHAWLQSQGASDIDAFRRRHAMPATPMTGVLDASYPYRGRYTLHPLADAVGNTVKDATYTAIVCSEETRAGCVTINAARAAAGLRPLAIVVAPLMVDSAGAKLSSTSIRSILGTPRSAGSGGGTPGGAAGPPVAR